MPEKLFKIKIRKLHFLNHHSDIISFLLHQTHHITIFYWEFYWKVFGKKSNWYYFRQCYFSKNFLDNNASVWGCNVESRIANYVIMLNSSLSCPSVTLSDEYKYLSKVKHLLHAGIIEWIQINSKNALKERLSLLLSYIVNFR